MSNPTDNLAALSSLIVEPGNLSPGLWGSHRLHTAYVGQGVTSVRLTAKAESPEAVVRVNGQVVKSGEAVEIATPVGRTIVTVEVRAPGGATTSETKRMHTVRLIRAWPAPNWTRAAETAPWVPRDSAGELVFKDRLWLFGGYTPGLVSDVWSSPDGVNWTQTGTIPSEAGVNIPVALAHADRMWVSSADGKLFSSPDGANWTLVTDKALWLGRYGAGHTVFNGRMWVMGGMKGSEIANDVWSSTDGVNWTLETPAAAWSPRQLFSMVSVHDGRMWAMGGGISVYHPFKSYRDVWSSEDGRRWEQATDCAPWPGRIWGSSATYRDRLWAFSGFRAEPTWNNFGDVWYSSDGANWRPLVTESVWSARHEVSPYVFDDKLWVIGGNAWPLVNDAWYLQIRGMTFVTQPVIQEFVKARYCYEAHADFNASGRPVRYKLAQGPRWLTLNAETGVLTGTPPKVEDVPVTIEASDDAGERATQSFVLHVIPVG